MKERRVLEHLVAEVGRADGARIEPAEAFKQTLHLFLLLGRGLLWVAQSHPVKQRPGDPSEDDSI